MWMCVFVCLGHCAPSELHHTHAHTHTHCAIACLFFCHQLCSFLQVILYVHWTSDERVCVCVASLLLPTTETLSLLRLIHAALLCSLLACTTVQLLGVGRGSFSQQGRSAPAATHKLLLHAHHCVLSLSLVRAPPRRQQQQYSSNASTVPSTAPTAHRAYRVARS